LAVGPVDLHHLDVRGGKVTGQAGTVGAGALHADPLELAEVAHPAHQPPVAGRRRRKPGRSQDSADVVDDRRYVDVLVGVDAADDSALLIGHDWLPFFARQWGIAPPAGTGGQDTQGADKAAIRSRPSDRSVRIPGQEPGRQISFKARGQSHRE